MQARSRYDVTQFERDKLNRHVTVCRRNQELHSIQESFLQKLDYLNDNLNQFIVKVEDLQDVEQSDSEEKSAIENIPQKYEFLQQGSSTLIAERKLIVPQQTLQPIEDVYNRNKYLLTKDQNQWEKEVIQSLKKNDYQDKIVQNTRFRSMFLEDYVKKEKSFY